MIKSLPLSSTGCLLASSLWLRETFYADRIPIQGPLIFTCNHSSLLDGILVTSWLNWQRKAATHTIAYKEPFEHWFYGWIMRSGRCIPFDRSDQDSIKTMLRKALFFIKNKEAVAIFPEGHLNNGQTLRLPRPGAALLALETGAPVIPLGVRGTRECFPLKELPRFKRNVSIHVGKIIPTAELSKTYHNSEPAERKKMTGKLINKIMDKISKLSGMPLHRRMRKEQ